MSTILNLEITAVVFCLIALLPEIALSNDDALTQQCLNEQSEQSYDLCKQAALVVASDESALTALAGQLEAQMRYPMAIMVYEIGSEQNTHSKVLLQNLIRTRAVWRKQKSARSLSSTLDVANESLTTEPDQSRDCYDQRYQQALGACRSALEKTPGDAGLHERLGDVLKSMGQNEAASHAYRLSLDIDTTNKKLKRKLNAMEKFINTSSLSAQAPNPDIKIQQPESSQSKQVDYKANSVATKQIELLDRLLKQKILSQDDYDYELQQVIAQAQSLKSSQQTQLQSGNQVGQKKLQSFGVGNYHALIVGNNDYKSQEFPDLLTAVNDAKKIDQILRQQYGFKTRILLNADRYDIMNEISTLRRSLKNEDKLLIYYAGHGVLDDKTRQGYWLPVDAEQDSIANWISANDITDALAGVSAQHAMVIADSCFSGSLIRGNQVSLDEPDALLIRLSSKRSRTVLTSGGFEPVQDDGGGRHSVFASALISILENNKGLLEAGKLFLQLRDKVVLNADQTPQYAPITKAGHDGGDFIFVPS